MWNNMHLCFCLSRSQIVVLWQSVSLFFCMYNASIVVNASTFSEILSRTRFPVFGCTGVVLMTGSYSYFCLPNYHCKALLPLPLMVYQVSGTSGNFPDSGLQKLGFASALTGWTVVYSFLCLHSIVTWVNVNLAGILLKITGLAFFPQMLMGTFLFSSMSRGLAKWTSPFLSFLDLPI